jgi:hypothetical protein
MKPGFRNIPAEELNASFNLAIAQRRHSHSPKFLCSGCGQWVSAIWHITIDRKRLCRACACPEVGRDKVTG